MSAYSSWSTLRTPVHLLLVASLALLAGQGCPDIIPINPGPGTGDDTQVGANTPPVLTFTAPTDTIQAEVGDVILASWTVQDPDDDARVSILVDPDATPDNGNEIPVGVNLSEDDSLGVGSISIDTGELGLTPATYRILAIVTDNQSTIIEVAPGLLELFAQGTAPGNRFPQVVVTTPVQNVTATHNDVVDITYCANDPDDGEGGATTDVLIILDTDNNPLNDLDLVGDDSSVCSSNLPQEVGGAIVLACEPEADCEDETAGTVFPYTVDVFETPPLAGGEPYRVRATVWDRTNPPVHAYAAGSVSISAGAARVADLGEVGRSISGVRYLGFNAGDWAGSTSTPVGDFDGDGADDFLLVARYGQAFSRGNVGSAYLIYGQPGQKLGGDITLNSIGSEYRGTTLIMGRASRFGSTADGDIEAYAYGNFTGTEIPVTEGITSVGFIEDLGGDGQPELLIGVPYAELIYDYVDDDPCDDDAICYTDGLPNPDSDAEPGNDDLSAYNFETGGACTDNGSPFPPTPINQGYLFFMDSAGIVEGNVVEITLTGQFDPGGLWLEEGTLVGSDTVPDGLRVRGAYWYRDFNTTLDFAREVGSMPDLSNGTTSPNKDGVPELLMSAPGLNESRGGISMIYGGNLSGFNTTAVKSLPDLRSLEAGDFCFRQQYYPVSREILGATGGDRLGYADRAGDFNRDGHQDILCGAPGGDRGGLVDNGIVYIIFGRLDFPDIDLAEDNPPRMEIHGALDGDGFGTEQTVIGDVNSDGVDDVGIAAPLADGPGGTNAGYVGIIFGGQRLTGENIFSVTEIGTTRLPGVSFYGSQPSGRAGVTLQNVGDFNGDGIEDLIITAPNETREINGVTRRGVAYLIFGGAQLVANSSEGAFSLDQVGSEELPGVVFVTPYAEGSADDAPIDWAGGAGDFDGDGLADLIIGVSKADFINPLAPNQRRIDAGEAYLVYGNNSRSNLTVAGN